MKGSACRCAYGALIMAAVLTACAPFATRPASAGIASAAQPSAAATAWSTPRAAATAIPATSGLSATPLPTVQSLRATVTADLLSCRYGPGPNYLFLYGLRKGANIVLIGRTDGDNWHWVYVAGRNKCWVKTDFLDIQGDWKSLPIVYPGMAELP